MGEELPRPLTDRERAVIERLLTAVELDGGDAFLSQLAVARVVKEFPDDPSVFLVVERAAARRAERYRGIPQSPLPAKGWYDADVPGGYEVMLFQPDGWLTMLDLVGYSEDPFPSEFPPPAEMEVWTSEGPDT